MGFRWMVWHFKKPHKKATAELEHRKELAKGRTYLGPVYQTPCELKTKVTERKDTEKEEERNVQA